MCVIPSSGRCSERSLPTPRSGLTGAFDSQHPGINTDTAITAQFSHNARWIYSCQDGYSPADRTTTQELVYCIDGYFSALNLLCMKDCSAAPIPDLTRYQVSMTEQELYRHGDTVSITCNYGYSPISGSSPDILMCYDGSWDTQTLRCSKNCNEWMPDAPTNGVGLYPGVQYNIAAGTPYIDFDPTARDTSGGPLLIGVMNGTNFIATLNRLQATNWVSGRHPDQARPRRMFL
jgi:hypothetical protein